MNKVILIGRLTKDPDLKFASGKGTAICNFTVAVNRRKKEDGADFIQCVAFGKTGETIANYLTKGREIAVTGSINTSKYDNKEGVTVYSTKVMVESFEFIGGKNTDNSSSNQSQDYNEGFTPSDDGDCPF